MDLKRLMKHAHTQHWEWGAYNLVFDKIIIIWLKVYEDWIHYEHTIKYHDRAELVGLVDFLNRHQGRAKRFQIYSTTFMINRYFFVCGHFSHAEAIFKGIYNYIAGAYRSCWRKWNYKYWIIIIIQFNSNFRSKLKFGISNQKQSKIWTMEVMTNHAGVLLIEKMKWSFSKIC